MGPYIYIPAICLILMFLAWAFIAGATRKPTPTRGTQAEEDANKELAKSLEAKK